MSLPIQFFSEDYPTARHRFLAAATVVGGDVRTYPHPLPGPDGAEIGVDCLWLGDPSAERVLVLSSGTHGIEGFSGAGPQLDFLLGPSPGELPGDTAALLIHGINPWGYAWLRRTTEEGVDLNRNFVDFAKPVPENPGYDEIASSLVPASIEPAALDAAEARLADYAKRHGEPAYLTARGSGQYRHPGGLFYGGTAPTWSRRTTETILADYRLGERQAVAVIDYHTGLGPYAYGELICDHEPGSVGATRGRRWYGPTWKEPRLGTSITVPLAGLSRQGWEAVIGDRLTFAYLEFGTLPPPGMQRALAQDHWLHNRGPVDWSDPETRRIKQVMLDAYLPPEEDWRESVLFRCRQVTGQALKGLASQ